MPVEMKPATAPPGASISRGPSAMLAFAHDADHILLDEQPNGPLFHYTDTSALVQVVQHKKLWASDLRLMNDTMEIEHGMKLIRAAVKRRAPNVEALNLVRAALAHPNFADGALFAISLSEDGDVLSQWRAYAADGAGYAVGFDSNSIQGLAPEEWGVSISRLCRVEYRRSTQRRLAEQLIDAAFRSVEPLAGRDPATVVPWVSMGFANVLLAFASVCKNAGFKEEQEWRLVYTYSQASFESAVPSARPKSSFRAGRYGLTPYLTVPFPASAITTITRGPKLGAHSEYVLRGLLAQYQVPNWSDMSLPPARASYR